MNSLKYDNKWMVGLKNQLFINIQTFLNFDLRQSSKNMKHFETLIFDSSIIYVGLSLEQFTKMHKLISRMRPN